MNPAAISAGHDDRLPSSAAVDRDGLLLASNRDAVPGLGAEGYKGLAGGDAHEQQAEEDQRAPKERAHMILFDTRRGWRPDFARAFVLAVHAPRRRSGARRAFRLGRKTLRRRLSAPRRAAPALAVRGRLPRSGKSSRLILSLRSLSRRVRMRLGDRCQAHRCAGGRLGSTRITQTELAARNRRAGFPAPLGFADRETKRNCAARGPLQTAAAVQHRHGAGGRRSAGAMDSEARSADRDAASIGSKQRRSASATRPSSLTFKHVQ